MQPHPELDYFVSAQSDHQINLSKKRIRPRYGLNVDLAIESIHGTKNVQHQNYLYPNNHARSVTGVTGTSFFDDFYNRIHFIPGFLNFGNVLENQTKEIKVWNAYFENKNVQSFNVPVLEGFSVVEPDTPPFDLGVLKTYSYFVGVTTNIPPKISETLQWVIDSAVYNLPVEAKRITVFPFAPTWDSPLVETLEWRTDVIESNTGGEQRIQVRSKPRQKLRYRFLMKDQELNSFKTLMYGWQNREFAVPMWTQRAVTTASVNAGNSSIPCDTQYRGFEAGSIGIILDSFNNYEVFEISAVNSNSIVTESPLGLSWSVNTSVYPLSIGKLASNIPVSHPINRVCQGSVEFEFDTYKNNPNIPNLAAGTLFDGVEYFTADHNWAESLNVEHIYNTDLFDPGIGSFQLVQTDLNPRVKTRYVINGFNRQDNYELRGLLGRLAGRWKPVYCPSGTADFQVVEKLTVATSSMKVKNIEYTNFVDFSEVNKAVVVKFVNGSRFVAKILGSTTVDSETEILSLGDSFPQTYELEQIASVNIVRLCRSYSDAFTINYLSDTVTKVEFNMISVTE